MTNSYFLFTNDLFAQKVIEEAPLPLDLDSFASRHKEDQMTLGGLLLLYSPWILLEIVFCLFGSGDVVMTCHVAIRLLDLEASPYAKVGCLSLFSFFK